MDDAEHSRDIGPLAQDRHLLREKTWVGSSAEHSWRNYSPSLSRGVFRVIDPSAWDREEFLRTFFATQRRCAILSTMRSSSTRNQSAIESRLYRRRRAGAQALRLDVERAIVRR
jgi:hypothetical protein